MRTERWTGTVGLVLLGSVIAGVVFESMGPNLSQTPQQMYDSFKNENWAVMIAGAILIVQKVLIVGFAVGLATLVARGGEKAQILSRFVLIAGGLQVAITMIYVATYVALASVANQLTVPIVFGIFTVGDTLDLAGDPFLGLMFGAAAYGLRRVRLISRWISYLGMAAGTLLLLGSFVILAPQGFFLALPMYLGVLLGVVWLLVVNIALVRSRQAQLDSAVAPAASAV